MSMKTTFICNICYEEFSGKEADIHLEIGGVGLAFRGVSSGDFILAPPRETNGKHFCNKCAQTLLQQLLKYFA